MNTDIIDTLRAASSESATAGDYKGADLARLGAKGDVTAAREVLEGLLYAAVEHHDDAERAEELRTMIASLTHRETATTPPLTSSPPSSTASPIAECPSCLADTVAECDCVDPDERHPVPGRCT